MKRLPHFHLHYSPPPAPDAPCWKDPAYVCPWPEGCWAVYQITGEEIGRRYGFDASGNVTFRDSWPGYVGMWATLAEAAAAIAELSGQPFAVERTERLTAPPMSNG